MISLPENYKIRRYNLSLCIIDNSTHWLQKGSNQGHKGASLLHVFQLFTAIPTGETPSLCRREVKLSLLDAAALHGRMSQSTKNKGENTVQRLTGLRPSWRASALGLTTSLSKHS